MDYEETFSPVAKLNTVRVLISVTAHRWWSLLQLDIKNAFLNGNLHETVYMQQPPGFEITRESQVCPLKKDLYDLKQSPRAWFDRFSKTLREVGFSRSTTYFSMFNRHRTTGMVLMLMYVDDIILTGGDSRGIQEVNNISVQFFKQRIWDPSGIFWALRLLDDQMVSSFLSGIGIVSRYTHSPRRSHLHAVERILRYLKTAPGQGLVYKTSSSAPTLIAYSDADYAGSLDDRRSTSGFCTYFGGHLITWRNKKQAVVARSSAEAEYRAMTSVVSELTWLESLLTDLGIRLPSPALLLCDSQAAIHIAKNPVFHERTKHIEVDCHFIREKVQMKKIDPKHVPGTEQVADVFTKDLPSTLFYQCLSKLGAYDLEQKTALIREAIHTRYSLLPYYYSLFRKASASGVPILRPLWLEFPEDKKTFDNSEAFMIGESILVQGIYEEGQKSVSVYLPGEQSWYSMRNGAAYAGGQAHKLDVFEDSIPSFQRAGSIVPRKYRSLAASVAEDAIKERTHLQIPLLFLPQISLLASASCCSFVCFSSTKMILPSDDVNPTTVLVDALLCRSRRQALHRRLRRPLSVEPLLISSHLPPMFGLPCFCLPLLPATNYAWDFTRRPPLLLSSTSYLIFFNDLPSIR
ncbi:hypothetical protein KSP39_PZI005094 [Platanthera zijinensis]|uniref:Reverse transcriptase Ty1/copia-type domain-containing protein n=1 Tax=Platanthera zijinensis TaxID=2320716 RepID=A0AAP0BRX0_9ASPA